MKAAFAAAALSLAVVPVVLPASPAAAQQDPAERARVEELTRRLNGAPPRPQSQPQPQRTPPAAPAPSVAPSVAPAPQASSAPPAARQDPAERARIEELTRRLNGAPPRAEPAPQPTPRSAPPSQAQAQPQARPQSPPQPRPAPPQPQAAPRSQPTPRTPPPPAAEEAPVSVRRPSSGQSTPAPAPGPQGLSEAERAALPFRVDLPAGFQLVEGRAAPGSRVYSARKAGKTYLMIYAGPSSQFPIYDGQQVTAGGRLSVVTTEGQRRIAMEHLFQRSTEPAEIHVWLMGLDGAERDEAERIAQTVDPR